MKNKGQTTVEYLLIIAVTIVLIAVVGRGINWEKALGTLGKKMNRLAHTVNTVTIDQCAKLAAEANE